MVSGEGVNWGCVIRADVSTGWSELCDALCLLCCSPQSPLASPLLAWQPLEAKLKGGGWLLGPGPGQRGHWEGGAKLWLPSPLFKSHQKKKKEGGLPWVMTGVSS